MPTLPKQTGFRDQLLNALMQNELNATNLTKEQKNYVLNCVQENKKNQMDDVMSMPPSTKFLEALNNLAPKTSWQSRITSQMRPISFLQGLLIDVQSLQEKTRVDLFILGVSAFMPTGEEAIFAKTISPILKPFAHEAEQILTKLRSGEIQLGERVDIDGETKVHILSLVSTGENLSWVVKAIPDAETARIITQYTNHLAESIQEISPVHLFDNHHVLQQFANGKTFNELTSRPIDQSLALKAYNKLVDHAEYLLRYEPPPGNLPKGVSVWIDTAYWNFRFIKNEFEKMEAKWFDVVGVKNAETGKSLSSIANTLGPDL